MKIEWFVSDLDGTLLDSKTCLGDENVNAVRELIASGVGVILATGRSDLFVKDYIFRLGITLPVISCNGGLVRDVWKNEVLFSRTIPRATVVKLADY